MDSPNPCRVVLVPRPLTLLAAFAHYAICELLPELNLFGAQPIFRWVDSSPRGKLVSDSGVVVNLNTPIGPMNDQILFWLRGPRHTVPYPEIKSLRDFAAIGEHNETWPKWKEFLFGVSAFANPEDALRETREMFSRLRAERIDPRKVVPLFPDVHIGRTSFEYPGIPDRRHVTLPVVKKPMSLSATPTSRQAFDFTIKQLSERNIFRLLSEHIVLAVGGLPGSGKSTLVASLFVEMTNILSSLTSREGVWESFPLTVDIGTLDLATPVTDSIILRCGQDREMLQAAKKPWTMELAVNGAREVQAKAAETNIVLADLPGKIDHLTETLSSPITFGGIITNDWSRIDEWRDFFRRVGIPVVFEIKATDKPSMMTSYWPGETISGRMNQLDRVARGWDSFVRTIAEMLLFDILPGRLDWPGRRLRELTSAPPSKKPR